MNDQMVSLRAAAPLLWLVIISGLATARLSDTLLLAVGLLEITVWTAVIIWAGWLAIRARRVPWTALTAWALLAFISPYSASVWRLKILFFIAVFILGQHYFNAQELRRAALLFSVIYIPLTFLQFGNTNVLAMNVWALALLVGYWPITLISLGVILCLGSEGAALALLAGALYSRWGWRGIIPSLAALPVMIWLKWGSVSVTTRLAMLGEAWAGFSASPWVGQGVGAFNSAGFRLPHNIFADAAYSAGLAGLLLGAAWLWYYRERLTAYGPFFIALAVHSMLDNPYWGVPGLLAAFIIGGSKSNGKW